MFSSRNWAEIDESALRHNIQLLQRRFTSGESQRIMAVVKADAYGHGLGAVVPVCLSEGITDFGVATVSEAAAVRSLAGSGPKVYLLTAALASDAEAVIESSIIPVISDIDFATGLAAEARSRGLCADVHLEVDTGIGRAGFSVDELPEILSRLDDVEGIRITGLMTHYASADEDAEDAGLQDDLFSSILLRLGSRANFLELHSDNSPGALIHQRSACSHSQTWLIRPGLLLYGTEPAPGMFDEVRDGYRPVMSLRARVTLCRTLEAGMSISYGRTYRVPEGGGTYATIPVGYGDGYARGLSNRGWVLLHGQRANICGRVCMDQFVVDVTGIPNVRVGDTATLLGFDGGASATAGELAAVAGLTPHELTTCLTSRVPRFTTDSGAE